MTKPYQHIAHCDIECFYDNKTGYSLTKMPTILYVRDPRYKTLGCAVALDDEVSRYLNEEEFIEWLGTIDWSITALSAYNTAFDGCVFTQIYKVFPCYYLDPQSAAKALIPMDSVALKVIAPLLGLGEKGSALISGSKENSQALADYACLDNELARGIFNMLYPMLSQTEQDLIDWTIRPLVEPILCLDADILVQVRDDAKTAREDLIAASGYTEEELSSNAKFLKIIRGLGLEAPMKVSKTTGKDAAAFSKADDEFCDFMTNYPEYNHIWDARLASKSMINVTRAQTFLNIAQSTGGTMPAPLRYCGASTGRWSGCDKLNVQNLPSKYKSNLRKAIVAPDGYVVVVSDSSQIELRLNMWFCGQTDKLELLREGGDIYKAEAATQFSVPISEVTKEQRQYGKLIQLACMYGQGARLFRKNAAAGPLGMKPIYLSEEESYSMINTYRAANECIPAMWRILDQRINQMTLKDLNEVQGCVTFVHEGVVFPSGRMLQYSNLEQTEDAQWSYCMDKRSHGLWGGTLLNNIIQGLARDIVAEQMLEINKRYRVVSMTHDECIFLAKIEDAEEALAFGIKVMSTSPSWAQDLPLGAEGGFDKSYSK